MTCNYDVSPVAKIFSFANIDILILVLFLRFEIRLTIVVPNTLNGQFEAILNKFSSSDSSNRGPTPPPLGEPL